MGEYNKKSDFLMQKRINIKIKMQKKQWETKSEIFDQSTMQGYLEK